MPAVTVLTTFFNAEKTILGSIQSILNQSFEDFELLLVNDGSTDNSLELVNQINDERVKIFSPGKIGRAAALNFGLKEANADYIAILDADDQALQDRLSIQYQYLSNNDTSLVASNALLFDGKGNSLGSTNYNSDHEELVLDLLNFKPFPHSSVMFKKNEVMEFSGYNERCLKSIDFNMYIDLIQRDLKIHCLKDNLIKLSVYSSSWGVSDSKSLQYFYGFFALVAYFLCQKNGVKIMHSSVDEYEVIKELLSEWFYNSKLYKSSLGKKYFREFRENLREYQFVSSLRSLGKAFKSDLLFFTHRGVQVTESDINNFIEYASENSTKAYKIINDVK